MPRTRALVLALCSQEKMLITVREVASQSGSLLLPVRLPGALWERQGLEQATQISHTHEGGVPLPPSPLPGSSTASPPRPPSQLPLGLQACDSTAGVEGGSGASGSCHAHRSPLPPQGRKSQPKDVTPLFLLPMGPAFQGGVLPLKSEHISF